MITHYKSSYLSKTGDKFVEFHCTAKNEYEALRDLFNEIAAYFRDLDGDINWRVLPATATYDDRKYTSAAYASIWYSV